MRRRLGRRGAVLLLLGAGYVVYGVLLVQEDRAALPGLELLADLVPLNVWGASWILTGLVAVAYAFKRGARQDAPGYMALVPMSALWGGTYLISWLVWLVAGPPSSGYELGAVRSLSWLLIVGVVLIDAGRADVPKAAP